MSTITIYAEDLSIRAMTELLNELGYTVDGANYEEINDLRSVEITVFDHRLDYRNKPAHPKLVLRDRNSWTDVREYGLLSILVYRELTDQKSALELQDTVHNIVKKFMMVYPHEYVQWGEDGYPDFESTVATFAKNEWEKIINP